MTMPPLFDDPPEHNRPYFRQLRELRDYLNEQDPSLNLTELSMGTSYDFEIAVEEGGATIVRLGQYFTWGGKTVLRSEMKGVITAVNILGQLLAVLVVLYVIIQMIFPNSERRGGVLARLLDPILAPYPKKSEAL